MFFTAIFFSCKKNISMIAYQGGTAPVISANKTGTIPLSFANRDNEAITLAWTNPAYKFSTGLSSQDVFYNVEIDTTGANFTNPKRQTVSVSKEMSKTFTQGELNDFLLNQLQLVPGAKIRMRKELTPPERNKGRGAGAVEVASGTAATKR